MTKKKILFFWLKKHNVCLICKEDYPTKLDLRHTHSVDKKFKNKHKIHWKSFGTILIDIIPKTVRFIFCKGAKIAFGSLSQVCA